jgi:hypothetical protein
MHVADTMTDAVTLMRWYVGEALRLHRAGRTDPGLLRAQRLLDWLQARPDAEIDFRDIMRLGPNEVRQKSAADNAVTTLVDHHWLAEIKERPLKGKLFICRIRAGVLRDVGFRG